MKRLVRSLNTFVKRMPWWVIAVAIVLSLTALPGIIFLKTDSSLNALVSPNSAVSHDSQRYKEQFGNEPITVLLAGKIDDIFTPDNLVLLQKFEGEITSNYTCTITSPLTILKQAVAQAQALQKSQTSMDQLNRIGEPSLNNPRFIQAVLYNQDGSLNVQLISLIPDKDHALILVTLVGDISDSTALKASHDTQKFFSANPLSNTSSTVISYSLVTEDISQSMKSNLLLLLGLAVLVMVAVLFLLFRVRWRLLSLLIVGIGALLTFGLMGYIPVPVTMATMAVLPILIGLGIDYPIQFHNRYQEEVSRRVSVAKAVVASIAHMMPAVGIALLATVIGFATLYISDVPMIRDFGIILVAGVVLCYLISLFLLFSFVYLTDKKIPLARLKQSSMEASGRIEKILVKIIAPTLKYPLAIFLVTALLGVGGIIADRRLPINTDYQQLIPQNLPALRHVRDLNNILGVGGQVTFLVEAEDVTQPDVIQQLKDYQSREMAQHSELISVRSPLTAPGQFVSADKKSASLSFGTSYISLEKAHGLLVQMNQDGQKLAGLRISPVGTMALGASSIDSIIGRRFLMDGLCLGAIFLILLLLYRRFTRAAFIIISVGIVIGWSSLALFIFGIPLNPLTAILGIITTAIGTEFMVLLSSRYEEEKAKGEFPRQAMLTAASKMGRAIVTTGVTTLGGFGVLIASNFVMIRDFGIATVIGIFLCLLSTLVVMPPLMVWWDERRG